MVVNITADRRVSRSTAIREVSQQTGIPTDTLGKWLKNRGVIISAASDKKSQDLKQVYNRPWLKSLRNLEELLAAKIRERRRQGLKAKILWILSNAKQIRKMPLVVDQSLASRISLSRSWYYSNFLPRYGFSIRRSSNRKQAEAGDAKPVLFQFHTDLFNKFKALPHSDCEFGHFSKRDIFNFDQVPLPFVCDGDNRTVDDKGSTRVWCRQPGSGLEKRQATMHLTLCADDDAIQPRPIIIFRGKGTNILNSSEPKLWVLYSCRSSEKCSF